MNKNPKTSDLGASHSVTFGASSYIAMTIAMIIWGISWPVGKFTLAHIHWSVFIPYRYFFSLLTLLLMAMYLGWHKITGLGDSPSVQESNKDSVNGGWHKYPLINGLFLLLYNFSYMMGIHYGLASVGGVLVTVANPIIAYFLGTLIGRKKLTIREKAGLIFGLLGGLIIISVWQIRWDDLGRNGNIYFILCAFLWVGVTWTAGRSRKVGSIYPFSFWSFFYAAFGSLGFLWFFPGSWQEIFAITDYRVWAGLVFMGAIANSGATILYFYSASHLGVRRTTTFTFIVPASAMIFSALLLQEPIGGNLIIGAVISSVALFFLHRAAPQKQG